MKKLKLNLEELAVESFGTGHEPAHRGTVHGRGTERCNTNWSCQGTCGPMNCGTYYCVPTDGGASCDIYCTPGTGGTSCNQPCVYTCDGAASCNANNTCISTCPGLPECG